MQTKGGHPLEELAHIIPVHVPYLAAEQMMETPHECGDHIVRPGNIVEQGLEMSKEMQAEMQEFGGDFVASAAMRRKATFKLMEDTSSVVKKWESEDERSDAGW